MARVPSKHGRDQTLDFQGFLNDLQDWELSLKDKDKKMKSQDFDKQKLVSSSQGSAKVGEDSRHMKNGSAADYSSARQSGFSRNFDTLSTLSKGVTIDENPPDAVSEKELGNEYFKQKKFKDAIDCYSRSIALSPTAVAYANRAMAYLKIKRFQEAEDDCTEALNLDDRYIKAYSRRATARKELGKLKGSIEDAEFASRLEPNNQEIKKQYGEAKSLYEKEILRRASGELKSSGKGVSNSKNSKVEVVQHISPVSVDSQRTEASPMQVDSTERNNRALKQEQQTTSMQDLASKAASRAKEEAAKNITPPNSAYQFEVSWRGFAGDRALQARLLKAMSPVALPQIFKNSLSAPILVDIIKCIATFFVEEMDLAVSFLENMTKVARFDMIMMCLSSADRNDLLKIWDDVFCGKSTPSEFLDVLIQLRSRYNLKR